MEQLVLAPPDHLSATVLLPASKSISNRALVMNVLSGGDDTLLNNLSDCDDTQVMIDWLHEQPSVINIKAAGTAMRFSSALLSIREGSHVITGTERMRHRPISILVDALRKLGADVEYVESEGFPPLRITGRTDLPGGELTLPGNVSSQYISALLMIGPSLEKGLILHLTGDVISRPYIHLTISMMRDFGADATWTDAHTIQVLPTPYRSTPYTVESDWSAASYWYEMVALSPGSRVVLPHLYENSYQGDSHVAEVFQSLGVETTFTDAEHVVISHTGRMVDRLDYDFVNQPDLAQTVVVACCLLGVPFRFTGLQSLKIKETDRIHALRTELAKLGYAVGEADDSVLYWDGERCEEAPSPAIDTYEDHRMAMSFAPAAIVRGHLRINHPSVVSKSYPRFWDDLKRVGFIIQPK